MSQQDASNDIATEEGQSQSTKETSDSQTGVEEIDFNFPTKKKKKKKKKVIKLSCGINYLFNHINYNFLEFDWSINCILY